MSSLFRLKTMNTKGQQTRSQTKANGEWCRLSWVVSRRKKGKGAPVRGHGKCRNTSLWGWKSSPPLSLLRCSPFLRSFFWTCLDFLCANEFVRQGSTDVWTRGKKCTKNIKMVITTLVGVLSCTVYCSKSCLIFETRFSRSKKPKEEKHR